MSVGRVDDSEELALLAAQSYLCKQAWTYMSSHGVFFNGPIESQPGFYSVPHIRAVLCRFAPDLFRFVLTDDRSPNAWFRIDAGNRAGDGCSGRADQALSEDGRAVVHVHGGAGKTSVHNDTARTYAFSVLVVGDDQRIRQDKVSVSPGGIFDLEYRVGRVLLGTVAD